MNVSLRTRPTNGHSADEPSLRQQIAAVTGKLVKLSSELQELMKEQLDPRELKERSELLQAQIQALQAQLAALMRRQAEQAAAGRSDGTSDRLPTATVASSGPREPPQQALAPGVLAVA